MDWNNYITTDPAVLNGKPHLTGTRLSVTFILDLFANGWSKEDVLGNYPTLNNKQIEAVFSFAAEILREETEKENS